MGFLTGKKTDESATTPPTIRRRVEESQPTVEPPSPSLAELEAVVERGLLSFAEAGRALAQIKERRLYRPDFATFSQYLEARWHLTKDYAEKLIAAAIVCGELEAQGLLAPTRESHARELVKVTEDKRGEVWQDSLDAADGKPEDVTAELIATKAAKHRKRKARRKAPKAITLKGKGWKIILTRSTIEIDPAASLAAALEQLQTRSSKAA